MLLSEKKMKSLKTIATIRNQIELLDSHKRVGLITDKQYNDSLNRLVKYIEMIEQEYDIEPPKEFSAFDLLFGDSMDKFNDMMTSFDVLVSKK